MIKPKDITQDMPIADFCDLHNACKEGRKWALMNCQTMADCWEKLPSSFLVWVATRQGVLTEKELRLFAAYCCRKIWNLLTDERSRKVVEAAEKHAKGEATDEQLIAARAAALAAAADATAAAAAARAAARAAASSVSSARAAARAAALAAARDIQADWLRENTKPNFKRA